MIATQPSDREAEEAVLGAMLVSAEATTAVLRIVRAEHFAGSDHRLIFEAILALRNRGLLTDQVAVKDELRKRGTLEKIKGGALYVAHLAEIVATPASAEHHARIVGEHADRRRFIESLHEAQEALNRGAHLEDVRARLRATVRDERAAEGTDSEGVPETLSVPASKFLAHSDEDRVSWTIEGLMTAEAVAFFGGEPKSLKSWAALDCAVAVSSGVPAFGRFTPLVTGEVLVVQEESRRADYARRLQWLRQGHGLDVGDLRRLHVASQPGVLIDEDQGRDRLVAEIEALRPALVVLDPLVRLHSADEDRSREMRPVLRFLRRLQAEHGCSVLVVHHMGKPREGSQVRAGQRLRGTGDLHALLDSALYFHARPGVSIVAVQAEHREAPPPEEFTIRLDVDEEAGMAQLVAQEGTVADVAALEAMPEVEAILEAHPEGLSGREVEQRMERRNQDVREVLRRLEAAGRATREPTKRPDALGRDRSVKVWKRRSA